MSMNLLHRKVHSHFQHNIMLNLRPEADYKQNGT